MSPDLLVLSHAVHPSDSGSEHLLDINHRHAFQSLPCVSVLLDICLHPDDTGSDPPSDIMQRCFVFALADIFILMTLDLRTFLSLIADTLS